MSNSNIQLVYEYLLYRLFDADFIHPSNLNDKEALFIPTGLDSPELLEQIDLKKFMENNAG